MADESAVEMFVGGLVLDPSTQAPVVVLKDETGEICLPIWIGVAEATSIATAIKQVAMERPLTHDLMYDVFGQIGIGIERVVITELKDSTYYAELLLTDGDRALMVDSRPSDAIALALRASAPIFVVESVLAQAKISFSSSDEESAEDEQHEDDNAQSAHEESLGKSEGVSGDVTPIDKEQWQKILEDLDPEDFKYKV